MIKITIHLPFEIQSAEHAVCHFCGINILLADCVGSQSKRTTKFRGLYFVWINLFYFYIATTVLIPYNKCLLYHKAYLQAIIL